MTYDIVIVGSGIAGSTLAMVLSKVGASVLVLERDSHPRFVIGESTVPASTMNWVHLADTYDLPELRDIAHYTGLKALGLTAYPKSQFWFGLHRAGAPLARGHEAMLETYPLGVGPDVHMLRADVDAYLVSRLEHHGVDYRDHTAVKGFEHDGEVGTLTVEGPDGPGEVRARLVFDATGHGALFGRLLGLRDEAPRLHTDTRAMFGHFRGVRLLDGLLPPEAHFRYSRDAGTQHHCFEGGWIWVIPFDTGVVSVGIVLDRQAFPLDRSIPVEDEWKSIIQRFPTVAEHLGGAEAIRPIIRTDRIQFSSRAITAPGVVLTPHAAAFVDPLFSTGLTQTNAFICRAAPVVARCLEDGDFDHRRFAPLERAFLEEIAVTDKIVSGTIASFDDYELFRQFWRSWIVGTNLQICGRVVGDQDDAEGCALNFGAASDPWREELDARHAVALDRSRPALERAYELEWPEARAGTWGDQWRWMKDQRAAAGLSLTTGRRLMRSALFRLARPWLPAFVHADNPFLRSFDTDVHAPGPISVQVVDPADRDFADPRLARTFRSVTDEFGGPEKVRPEGWQDLSRRAQQELEANARTLETNDPPIRAAALRAIERRSTGAVTELTERDPLLNPPDGQAAGAP